MSDVFISYARGDRARAEVLAGALEDQGWAVWWDRDVLPGKRFTEIIKNELDKAKCIIVLWSKLSVESDWVQDEAAEGNRRRILVPAKIDDVEIPFGFRSIQTANLIDWDGTSPHSEFDRLLRAVSVIAGQPSLPKQPVESPESATVEESVVPDSHAPIEKEATEPVSEEAKVVQEAEEPPPQEVSESTSGAPDKSEQTDLETDQEQSKRRMAKVIVAICIVALVAIGLVAVFFTFGQPKTYSLTFSAVNGYIASTDQDTFTHGETATLTAVPDAGYSFTNWSGDLSGSANPATLVMDSDKSVTANFAFEAGKVLTNFIGMKLVYIPAGSFMMGSGDSAAQLAKEYDKIEHDFAPEFPQHQVRISEGFWMGQTEVTQDQYMEVMKDEPWSEDGLVEKFADNPAVCVNWKDAVEFCRKLTQQEGRTYRLPTEAEWEYACRAGTTTRFSFGDDSSSLGNYGWFRDNAYNAGQKYAHRVGQKNPNPWGLYDMHGNACEWCSDFYNEKYYYASPLVDPTGPSGAETHCVRGGAWFYSESALRCSYRDSSPTPYGYPVIGFRVVRSQ